MTLLIDGGEPIELPGHSDIKCITYRESGLITMQRGKFGATIDTEGMTREEVATALMVGIHQIEQQEAAKGGNRHHRRARASQSVH